MATSRQLRDQAFREMEGIRDPKVIHTRRKQGDAAAERVKRAKALDLARKRGAKIPRRSR